MEDSVLLIGRVVGMCLVCFSFTMLLFWDWLILILLKRIDFKKLIISKVKVLSYYRLWNKLFLFKFVINVKILKIVKVYDAKYI